MMLIEDGEIALRDLTLTYPYSYVHQLRNLTPVGDKCDIMLS